MVALDLAKAFDTTTKLHLPFGFQKMAELRRSASKCSKMKPGVPQAVLSISTKLITYMHFVWRLTQIQKYTMRFIINNHLQELQETGHQTDTVYSLPGPKKSEPRLE